MSTSEIVLWSALVIGLIYGVMGQVSGFCLNSALRHQFTLGDGTKLRAFSLALLVAVLGTQFAHAWGLIDLSQSIYRATTTSWLLIFIGGVLFGFGMLRARGCGARALILLGQGNLRSLVVLLCLGISAYMTLTGVLGPWRDLLAQHTSVTLQASTFESDWMKWGFIVLFGLAIVYFLSRDHKFWGQRRDVLSGIVIGALVVAGWLVTGWIGFDEFEPTALSSLTFVAPIGATIQYSMIASGMSLNFGIAIVLGVVTGSYISARLNRQFKWEGFEKSTDMPRYLVGALCMGVGGALAMGCSIGQGITGMSTLSYTSMLALAGICAGGWLALRLEASPISTSEPVNRQAHGNQYQQGASSSK
jgi:uncharacterized protein